MKPTIPFRRTRPKRVLRGRWTLDVLQEHLQYAVDLELWTIPYYLTALGSIREAGTETSQLLRSIVNQEMLHMQLAANLANAYGGVVSVTAPVYGGAIPQLDFSLDHPNPTRFFSPWSSNLGPLDETRINSMCLIEYPNWNGEVDLDPNTTEYGSIGDFYSSVAIGAEELKGHIRGGRNQVDMFQNFYPGIAHATVTRDGVYGWPEVQEILNTIITQGEGRFSPEMGPDKRARVPVWLRIFSPFIPPAMQNLADDIRPQASHFEKLLYIKRGPLPATWTVGAPSEAGRRAQERLRRNFAGLCESFQALMRGKPAKISPEMFQIAGDIVSCWKCGAVPSFS